MAVKGIDVSQWQGNIDFAKVKASGVEFVIIRAGYGREVSQRDPYFEQSYKAAKAAGLDVGAYWYSYATDANDAKKEAQACAEIIKGKTFEYPIYFDLEEQWQLVRGTLFCSSLVRAFCDTLKAAGYYTGLYMSRAFLQTAITQDIKDSLPIWVAEWGTKLNYTGKFGIWQYGTAPMTGITGPVDVDYGYVDYPTIIKNGGYNGFKKSSTPKKTDEKKKNIDEIAQEVIAGKWANDPDRKKKLAEAGYDAVAVQKRVNEILSQKKSVDQIADEVIAGKWGNGDERKSKLTKAGYDYAAVQKRVNEKFRK